MLIFWFVGLFVFPRRSFFKDSPVLGHQTSFIWEVVGDQKETRQFFAVHVSFSIHLRRDLE